MQKNPDINNPQGINAERKYSEKPFRIQPNDIVLYYALH